MVAKLCEKPSIGKKSESMKQNNDDRLEVIATII